MTRMRRGQAGTGNECGRGLGAGRTKEWVPGGTGNRARKGLERNSSNGNVVYIYTTFPLYFIRFYSIKIFNSLHFLRKYKQILAFIMRRFASILLYLLLYLLTQTFHWGSTFNPSKITRVLDNI
jgi:hypothetical protein